MKRSFLFLSAILWTFSLSAQQPLPDENEPAAARLDELQENMKTIIRQRTVPIAGTPAMEKIMPKNEVCLIAGIPAVHPAHDLQVPDSVLQAVAERVRQCDKDTLHGYELVRLLQPYLRWCQWVDPHLRVEPQGWFVSPKAQRRHGEPVPALQLLHVNDTLIVHRTADPQFRVGDRVLRINGTPVETYLEACYDDRYLYAYSLLNNNGYEQLTASEYRIGIERNGEPMTLSTQGMRWREAYHRLIRQCEFQTRTFAEAGAGYFAIAEFYPNNSLIIKRLRKAIIAAQKAGCRSFILDLRGNPGGNGDRFDELLSIFIDRDSIPYMADQRICVSPITQLDYEFLKDSVDESVVAMPDEYVHRTVPLDRKKYLGAMRYYVLMDKDTQSTAATFCNILQYNDAALLAGEPLHRNALAYGECASGWLSWTPLYCPSIATVAFDEHTRATDGIVRPDIAIPYVAAEHLDSRDAVLERLLERIAQETKN
ncbi:MAG: S41 family peptidase [Alistipes senegalensis]|nr:S41 family peptidase [Bacteroides cellulosilyticus]MCM1352033.1 S41 family peptidase [Alistipes senegalensis]